MLKITPYQYLFAALFFLRSVRKVMKSEDVNLKYLRLLQQGICQAGALLTFSPIDPGTRRAD
jgi:hypothetical protein